MLVEKLKEIVDKLNQPFEEGEELYHFNYGSGHWQNIEDYSDDGHKVFEERNKYLLLIWQDREKKFNQYGALIGYEFTGEMLFVVRSKIDDSDYNYKYETHIKNLYSVTDDINDEFTSCSPWLVKRWKEIEVENTYDTNLDGLKVQFTLTYNIDE